MSAFNPNDKVICINDDCRQSVWGTPAVDFEFPEGVIQEGAIYCVVETWPDQHGTQGLILASPRIFTGGSRAGWNSSRFRRMNPREEEEIAPDIALGVDCNPSRQPIACRPTAPTAPTAPTPSSSIS